MPHIKINQPTEDWLGTTVEIDGQEISNITSVDYHVEVDKNPTLNIGVCSNSNIDIEADYINLDISPVNVKSAIEILRSELSQYNPRCRHYGINNKLRDAFIDSIYSVLNEYPNFAELEISKGELAEKILNRIIGED